MRSDAVRLPPLLLTVSDAARQLRRHEQTVRAMIRRGDLAAVRLGRLVRILATAVDRAAPAMIPAGVHARTYPGRSRRAASRSRI
jgi:excisionase family DNA binding protein